jgi:hypothetical protein
VCQFITLNVGNVGALVILMANHHPNDTKEGTYFCIITKMHHFGLSAVETIRDNQSYERMCLDNGVFVQDYITDSGAFKANNFVKHIHDTHKIV